MVLTSLPLEVLETILLYLGVKDLVTLCETVDIKVDDYFWKQVCKRERYVRLPDSDYSWKTIFQLNNNWQSGNFLKREYEFDYPKRNVLEHLSRNGNIEHFIHEHNLLIQSDSFNISVWNVEDAPKLVQSLPKLYLTSAGTKILTKDLSSIIVYSVCNKIYKELVKINIGFVQATDYFLTNDFFAVFDNENNSIKIVNLRDLEISTIDCPSKRRFKLTISSDILYVMTVKETKYLLTRFDLVNKLELDDLVLFSAAFMISVPNVRMCSELIVSWSHELDSYSLTPIKVWNTNGELVNTLQFDTIMSCLSPQEVSTTGSQLILWMIVEGDYLIFSPSLTRIVIWCSRQPDVFKEITKDQECYNGQTTVSTSLLILSYTHCMKVVDFKKATYLYEVNFETKRTLDSFNYSFITTDFFANHYNYLVLQAGAVDGECLSYDNGISDDDPKCLAPVNFTKCFMSIYDFRGELNTI